MRLLGNEDEMSMAGVTVIMDMTQRALGKSENAPVAKAETAASAKDAVSAIGA